MSMVLQVPVAPPPGIDPAMYEQALEYLRNNPEAAIQAQQQMKHMGSPAMAQAASQQLQDPAYRYKPCTRLCSRLAHTVWQVWAAPVWHRQLPNSCRTHPIGSNSALD